jgi:hypothetical protein
LSAWGDFPFATGDSVRWSPARFLLGKGVVGFALTVGKSGEDDCEAPGVDVLEGAKVVAWAGERFRGAGGDLVGSSAFGFSFRARRGACEADESTRWCGWLLASVVAIRPDLADRRGLAAGSVGFEDVRAFWSGSRMGVRAEGWVTLAWRRVEGRGGVGLGWEGTEDMRRDREGRDVADSWEAAADIEGPGLLVFTVKGVDVREVWEEDDDVTPTAERLGDGRVFLWKSVRSWLVTLNFADLCPKSNHWAPGRIDDTALRRRPEVAKLLDK